MSKLFVLAAVLAILLLSPFSIVRFDKAEGTTTISVPTDFPTIQEAINNATEGDLVYVYNGTYYENVVINKTISLVGEDSGLTFINGGGSSYAVRVDSNNVSVSGFTIKNSSNLVQVSNVNYMNLSGNTMTEGGIGVQLLNANSAHVASNNITFCQVGIQLDLCDDCLLEANHVTDCSDIGVYVVNSRENVLISNSFARNVNYGVHLNGSAASVVDLNSFVDNGCGARLLNASGTHVANNNVAFSRVGVQLELCDECWLEANNVTDSGDAGVYLVNSRRNVLISNNFVRDTNYGVRLSNSAGNTIDLSSFLDNGCGVQLYYSGDNSISNNIMEGSSREGVLLYYSTGNRIENNDLAYNTCGLKLAYSGNNTLRGNNMVLNGYNFDVEAATLPTFTNDIDTSNTVDGKPIYYLVNRKDIVMDSNSNVGYVALVNCADILLRNLNLSANGEGVLVAYSSRCTIENTSLISNRVGVYLDNSSFIQVKNNVVARNSAEGIFAYDCYKSNVDENSVTVNGLGMYLFSLTNSSALRNNVTDNIGRGVQMLSSNYNLVSQNNLSSNGLDGIYLYNSNGTTLSDNEVVGNGRDGMWIDTSAYDVLALNNVSFNKANGIYLLTDVHCQVQNNRIVGNNFVGLQLSVKANNNTLTGNSVTENVRWGINMYDCSYNMVYGNNFVNRYQIQLFLGSVNYWDDGYPHGGNYWSDYGQLDLFSGEYQNLTGSDGIGDKPYLISTGNVDRYPLTSQSRIHDVAVLNVVVFPTEGYVGWIVDINATVCNLGDFLENVNVTIYSDETAIKNFTVSNLHLAESIMLTHSWNTSTLTPHNYTIECEAMPVPGETNLGDNVWPAGTLRMKMSGDVDGNGAINIIDIASIAVAFGSRVGDTRYRLNKDMNRDNLINIIDITIAARNFGKEVSS